MRLVMLSQEKRVFSLDYSLLSSFFNMKVNCAWVEGLVDDIFEGLGHLDCIFCPSSCNKMDSMMNIGRRKFGWMITNGLLKARTLFGVKSEDGGCMKTSCECNEVGRMANTRPRENVVLLSRREDSHDNDS